MSHGANLKDSKGQSAAKIRRNMLTIEDAKNKIKNKWPGTEFEILEFNGSIKKCKIKCLKCGEIIERNSFSGFLQNKIFCNNCKNLEYNKKIDKILISQNLVPIKHFMIKREDGRGSKHYVTIHCNICNNTWDRIVDDIITNKSYGCLYCREQKNYKENFIQQLQKYGHKHFSLISEFDSNRKSVLIRHEDCGFIFRIKPKSIIGNKDITCPKCQKLESKGEQKIREYLEENKIKFESQVRFLELGRLSFDFKITQNNQTYLIEFQGEQHYRPIKRFGGEEHFIKQQIHDQEKRDFCKQNGYILIEIPYKDMNKIETYLNFLVQRLK